MERLYQKKHDALRKARICCEQARSWCVYVSSLERQFGDSEHAQVTYDGTFCKQLELIIDELSAELEALEPMVRMEERAHRAEEVTIPDIPQNKKDENNV